MPVYAWSLALDIQRIAKVAHHLMAPQGGMRAELMRREKDLFAVLGRQPLRNMNIAAMQQLDGDVGVEQITRHRSARFSTGGWAARSRSGRLPISSVNNCTGQPCCTA